MNDLFDVYLYNRTFAIGLEATSLVFFAAFTVYNLVGAGKRIYLPSLLIIDFGIVAGLVRTLFFSHLSPHPARAGGIWRLSTAAILVWGLMLFERTRRRERGEQQR